MIFILTISYVLVVLVSFDQMAENKTLQDILLVELSDVNLFCKLIKYPAIRDNMLNTFKVNKYSYSHTNKSAVIDSYFYDEF